MTTAKQFDQMWQRHTVVIGASEPALHQSRECFGLLNVLGLAEENLGSDEANGYVTVTAKNAKDARAKVHGLMVQMDYNGCDANTDMMPGTPDLMITGEPVKVEPEDE